MTGLVAMLCASAPQAGAQGTTESFRPVERTGAALLFDVRAVSDRRIEDASLQLRKRGGDRVRHPIGVRRVAAAARAGRDLRVRRARHVRSGKLRIGLESLTPDPQPSPTGCSPDPASLNAAGCEITFDDPGRDPRADSLWGRMSCQDDSRHRLIPAGGDQGPTALGLPQASDGFRRLTVVDGDDYYGERCEIGRNEHRYGTGGGDGTAALYREGQRRLTYASFRLPANYPLEDDDWQVVMQMKQTQPSANGGGTPVLALGARDGRWALMQSDSSGPSSLSHEVWSAPAQRGRWTRFAFDVTYSQDPELGSVKVYADLDGDSSGPGEQSPTIDTYTLKRETAGGNPSDGIEPGESIPSHLRVGVYHNPDVRCPAPDGCSIDIDNVQVLAVD